MKSIIALNIIILLLSSCSEKQTDSVDAPQPVEVITINGASATIENDYTASIQGKSDVEIRPQVEGFLEKVYVDEGSSVQAGQTLFKINDEPFREQLNSASAQLQAALAAITNAQLEIDKLTPLVQNKVVAEYQLKAAKGAYQIAEANATQARANLASAKIRLEYTTIKAPVSGYIGRIPKKKGSLVSPSDLQPLTEVSDVHEIYAYFSLGEKDFINFNSQYQGNTLTDKLRNIPPVSLVLADNTVYTYQGRITMVDGQFDKNTGSITVRATFPNSQGLLRSGNTGKVRMPRHHKDAILVPQSATLDVQDKIFVFSVGDSNKVTKQPISVIGKSGSNYIVKDGVKPGDKIVFTGLDHLAEGIIIKPVAVKDIDQISIGHSTE
ncbi:MAG: efflux RND transporter periplasmic adaptor subunit [Sporocytophaga sp.]|uniref:efflux RND transporter periplasmic adaptor subunit n=1 Tax=Sporocytophaga sp. TaxID=2231183 RepID=UPI001B264ED2|nr:efflux RND transporter periplasmic adaptor subunit [Sporocytophaga sp.]MBO9703265.1 efflux RND transporter periplasmic adaptor subunit [Sporocytophaga sp.]